MLKNKVRNDTVRNGTVRNDKVRNDTNDTVRNAHMSIDTS